MNAGTPIAERWAGEYRKWSQSSFLYSSQLICELIEALSASEERERVLRERAVQLVGAGRKMHGFIQQAIDLAGAAGYCVMAEKFILAFDSLAALATPAAEQPAQTSAEKAGE